MCRFDVDSCWQSGCECYADCLDEMMEVTVNHDEEEGPYKMIRPRCDRVRNRARHPIGAIA